MIWKDQVKKYTWSFDAIYDRLNTAVDVGTGDINDHASSYTKLNNEKKKQMQYDPFVGAQLIMHILLS